MKPYKEPECAVYNRNNQKQIVYKTTSLETAEKICSILSENFPDEYKGNSFFIMPLTCNPKITKIMFEHQVIETYKQLGFVDLKIEVE